MELILFLLTAVLTLGLTALILRRLIPALKSRKLGQKILDIGPRWHKSKEGTPTMGGLSFAAASLLVGTAALLTAHFLGILPQGAAVLCTALYALLNGCIGFLDDRTKFHKKQNEGLKAYEKYLLQLILAGAYLFALRRIGFLTTEMYLPYFDRTVDMGWFYYIIALLLLTGIVNSVNLADGIDGLCASETAVIGVFFALVGHFTADTGVSLLSALVIGSCLGFLVYNWHPARVFMGDTGSLFLGGAVVGLAFLSRNPLIVLVCGFMYVLESISDILQVLSFKLTGKRIFRMAPIHHHFEKCGWGEVRIVIVFSLCTLLFCVLSFFGFSL